MGRFIDLCAEVAAEADEGGEGFVLPPDAWERFRQDFADDEIEDALKIVRENYLQGDLVDAADSLSGSLVEILGGFGAPSAFAGAEKEGGVRLSLEIVDSLARRLSRLENILGEYRDGTPPDRKGFDALMDRLLDHGLESDTNSRREDP